MAATGMSMMNAARIAIDDFFMALSPSHDC
jgi:hypothetical protein